MNFPEAASIWRWGGTKVLMHCGAQHNLLLNLWQLPDLLRSPRPGKRKKGEREEDPELLRIRTRTHTGCLVELFCTEFG